MNDDEIRARLAEIATKMKELNKIHRSRALREQARLVSDSGAALAVGDKQYVYLVLSGAYDEVVEWADMADGGCPNTTPLLNTIRDLAGKVQGGGQ